MEPGIAINQNAASGLNACTCVEFPHDSSTGIRTGSYIYIRTLDGQLGADRDFIRRGGSAIQKHCFFRSAPSYQTRLDYMIIINPYIKLIGGTINIPLIQQSQQCAVAKCRRSDIKSEWNKRIKHILRNAVGYLAVYSVFCTFDILSEKFYRLCLSNDHTRINSGGMSITNCPYASCVLVRS